MKKGSLIAALREHMDRESGRKEPDGGGLSPDYWRPSDTERQACCTQIGMPKMGHTLKAHCGTTYHISQLFEVNEDHLTLLLSLELRGYKFEVLERIEPILINMINMIERSTGRKTTNPSALVELILKNQRTA